MAVITYGGMVRNAMELAQEANLWVGIGGTSSWPNDAQPPAESPSTTALDTPVGYKRINMASCCIPDANGAIVFAGQKFTLVSLANALAQTARWVYIQASINYSELPIVTYRERGIFADLVPLPAYSGQSVLLPNQISSPGQLIYLAYSTPITRDANRRDVIEIVREFKS